MKLGGRSGAEYGEEAGEAVAEGDARLPAEEGAGARGVAVEAGDVVAARRGVDERARRAGEIDGGRGELAESGRGAGEVDDRDLARDAELTEDAPVELDTRNLCRSWSILSCRQGRQQRIRGCRWSNR